MCLVRLLAELDYKSHRSGKELYVLKRNKMKKKKEEDWNVYLQNSKVVRWIKTNYLAFPVKAIPFGIN